MGLFYDMRRYNFIADQTFVTTPAKDRNTIYLVNNWEIYSTVNSHEAENECVMRNENIYIYSKIV